MDNDRLEKTVQRLTDEFMRDEIGLSEALALAWEDGTKAILEEWRKTQEELESEQTGRNLGSAG